MSMDQIDMGNGAPKDKPVVPITHPAFPDVVQMLPEPKRLLLEALRSGRFKQGRHNLAINEGDGMKHCCLGVMSECAIEAGVNIARVERKAYEVSLGDPAADSIILAYDGCTTMPPPDVYEWAFGTTHIRPMVVIDEAVDGDSTDMVTKAIEMVVLNDERGWSFEQIADAIEDSL